MHFLCASTIADCAANFFVCVFKRRSIKFDPCLLIFAFNVQIDDIELAQFLHLVIPSVISSPRHKTLILAYHWTVRNSEEKIHSAGADQYIEFCPTFVPNPFQILQRAGPEMKSSIITKGRYEYVHDLKIGPPEAIDVHHIFIARRGIDCLSFCSYALRCAAVSFLCFLLMQKTMSVYDLLMLDKPDAIILWSFVVAGFLVRQFLRRQIEKESVLIFPAFGVQLETVYRSGKTVHKFVPIDKILKPVLCECVTPVTCYWSLSLILRGEEDLLQVFKGLYPPATMLVPIWKALCAAIDDKEWAEVPLDCDPR